MRRTKKCGYCKLKIVLWNYCKLKKFSMRKTTKCENGLI